VATVSGIGPVEPGEGTATYGDVIGAASERPRPADRWAALPRRSRRSALALAAASTLAGIAGYVCATSPGPPQPQLPPWPAQVTRVDYNGPGSDPPDRTGHTFTLRFDVTVTEGPPVTVQRIETSSGNVSNASTPATPFTVTPGRTTHFVLRFHVRDCHTLPREAVQAFLDVTLRNARAKQTESYIIDGDYPGDLFTALRSSCRAS
jgi:hypothetical protein